jgi:hypothetical protein
MRFVAFAVAVWFASTARAADPILIEPGPAGLDTAVYRFLPDSPRDPDSPSLYAFTNAGESGNHDFRSYLRFDLPESLAGACLEKAEIYVFYGFEFSGFGAGENVPGVLWCEPVLSAWSETGMTWNAQPARGAPVDVIEGIDAFGYLACDVTSLAQGWVDGAPNHGIALSSPTGRVMGFYSFEAQVDPVLRPALAVTLAGDPLACPEPGRAVAGVAAVLVAAMRRWR